MKKSYSKRERASWIRGLNLGKMRVAQEERVKNKNNSGKHFAEEITYSDDYFNSLITKVVK